jgi:glycosyltransferase involved in cell wall biosynthesis
MTVTWERPPIATSPISVILPAFQAEKHLAAVLPALVQQLEDGKREYEVILINDGSTDGTRAIADEWAGKNASIKCLHHESPQGYGVALRAGLAAARHPLLFTMPADGAYRAQDLPRMLEVIDQVDVVCGCRQGRPWLKTQWHGWLAFLGFGLWLKDVGCPVRLYRKSIFPRIPVQSKGRFADVEILAKANFLNCLLTEVEVGWQPAETPLPRGAVLADALRVFTRPDFGPPQLPTTEPPAPPPQDAPAPAPTTS